MGEQDRQSAPLAYVELVEEERGPSKRQCALNAYNHHGEDPHSAARGPRAHSEGIEGVTQTSQRSPPESSQGTEEWGVPL